MNTASSPKLILFGAENRKRLMHGAAVFAKAVCATYGPHGRVVMLDRAAGLLATKDGVTVAREIDLADPVEDIACQALKSACIKANDDAGDGTTSAACIASAIIQEGCKLVEAGLNPIGVAQGVQRAARAALEGLERLALPIETQQQMEKVALIASNGDAEVAGNLAEAVMAVGKNGTVSIEDGNGIETVLVFKEGLEIDRGAASMHFLREDVERHLDGPLVAVVAATLRTVEDVLDMCEEATTLGGRPLLLICEGIEGDALKTFLMNDANKDNDFEFVAVLAPGNFDRKLDYMGDIAALAGADLIDPRQGGSWKKWDRGWFGALRTAKVEAKKTTLIAYDEASESIQARRGEIANQRLHTTSQYDIDRINERLAALEGGLCIMQIGAYTEAELKEKRARVEDALGAVQAALEGGIVPGGGISYLAASQYLEGLRREEQVVFTSLEDEAGWKVLERALHAPLSTLAQNAGKNGDYFVAKMLDIRTDPFSWVGWDAVTDEIRDFETDTSVIDPLNVAVAVLEAATSSAATLMTAEASITMLS